MLVLLKRLKIKFKSEDIPLNLKRMKMQLEAGMTKHDKLKLKRINLRDSKFILPLLSMAQQSNILHYFCNIRLSINLYGSCMVEPSGKVLLVGRLK